MKETELARKVVDWLQDLQWDCYFEVQIFAGGNIADIVAVQHGLIWIIETKTSLSLAVIGQAFKWSHYANRVSVAVPWTRRRIEFADTILKQFGIGLLRVFPYDNYNEGSIRESIHPKLNRHIGDYLKAGLNDGHKTYADPGNSKGRRWSPFKETCLQIYRYVSVNEGCTVKKLIESVNHHYASNSTARICIPKWAEAGKIERVKCIKEGNQWRFYTCEKERGDDRNRP